MGPDVGPSGYHKSNPGSIWNQRPKLANGFQDIPHIGCIGNTAAPIDEFEVFIGFISTIHVRTTPSALFQYENEFVVILKDWMGNGALFNASGVHSEAA